MLSEAHKQDFLKFEGNAQTFRILTRLQLRNDDFGLNLTYATLSAILKYPVPSNGRVKGSVCTKKHGFFQSEARIVEDVWKKTGLGRGLRHPLTFLMEACDDIAYTVLDTEDSVKKGLVSFPDLAAYLLHCAGKDALVKRVTRHALEKHQEYRRLKLSPAELNDISMQKFRVYAIAEMVSAVLKAFRNRSKDIESGSLKTGLLEVSDASKLRECLGKFDEQYAYQNKVVLGIEAVGYKTIVALMDILWRAIISRENAEDLSSKRTSPFLRYAYAKISENYRRIFENSSAELPIRYREAQLLTDMISGMTDSFAIDLLEDLKFHADRNYGDA